jgi:uncharacterized alpha-E superfamily protein
MMLSRIAENAFWMGRYIERAESFVQVLSVTDSFASDMAEEDAWGPLLDVYNDRKFYASRDLPVTEQNVVKFYLTDKVNLNSAYSCVKITRENARSLRHLISTESWLHISIFHEYMEALAKRRFSMSKLAAVCKEIQVSCSAHRGVIETTWYRDEAWLFNQVGAALERADQMTRLLDMKYYQTDAEDEDAAPVADVAWWNSLLRSASGYHAFKRRHSFNPKPEDAARFLLHDTQFPRSVRGAADTAFRHLKTLERDFKAKPGKEVNEAAAAFAERLKSPPPKLIGRSLHRYIDQIQLDIVTLSKALYDRYFEPG